VNTALLQADQRFAWSKKLRKADDFSSVFRLRPGSSQTTARAANGAHPQPPRPVFKQRGAYLEVFVRPNPVGYARLGLMIPKRVLPRAVDRNRVKRWVREVFRIHQDEWVHLDVIVRLMCVQGLDWARPNLQAECLVLMRQTQSRAVDICNPINYRD
jgi:ribonuclease P protein component